MVASLRAQRNDTGKLEGDADEATEATEEE